MQPWEKIPLRIDANQGWKVNEAIETLKALAKYDIQHCEEPIARWKFLKLRKIKRTVLSPLWQMKVVVTTMMQNG